MEEFVKFLDDRLKVKGEMYDLIKELCKWSFKKGYEKGLAGEKLVTLKLVK